MTASHFDSGARSAPFARFLSVSPSQHDAGGRGGDSDQWPLRREREKIYDKARCHNHLDFLRASELPHPPPPCVSIATCWLSRMTPLAPDLLFIFAARISSRAASICGPRSRLTTSHIVK